MCHLRIFESNVKSSESWFLSGKILYFLGTRVCYLVKIISWNVWKASPVQLLPVWSSCVCNMLWEALLLCRSHVNTFSSVFWTCVLTAEMLVTCCGTRCCCHMFCLLLVSCFWSSQMVQTVVTCSGTCAVSCLELLYCVIRCMFICAIVFWVDMS